MIKLIAIDLDGTLLHSDGTISPRSKAVIDEVRKRGIAVVVCTGRPYFGCKHFVEELGLDGDNDFLVTCNGAVIQVAKTGEMIYKKGVSAEEVKKLYEESVKYDLPMDFVTMDGAMYIDGPGRGPSIYKDIIVVKNFIGKNLEEVTDETFYIKGVLCSDKEGIDAFEARNDSKIFEDYTLVRSRPILIEVLPKGINKGDVIKRLAEQIGATQDEVMAFGDEINDASMLEYAGYGFLMENAAPGLEKYANYRAPSNDEDGVAMMIEEYVLDI